MADAIRGNLSGPAFVLGGLENVTGRPGGPGLLGLAFGGFSSWRGTDTADRHWQFGARRETVEGDPLPDSLALEYPGFWRFRWAVGPGNRSLSIFVKQDCNLADRPSIVLKSNTDVGLLADVTTVAGSSITWIGMTAAFVATGTGMIWVELHNNLTAAVPCTCYFDRISVV
jgi:hypothetical protein